MPDEKNSNHCVICLNACEDRTFLETCHHEFCFQCILQWSDISRSCPLCVRIFDSCIHEIRDDERYTVYRFRPPSDSCKKGSPSSATNPSTSHRPAQDSTGPYGIIRQLYGPPQRRRRFRNEEQIVRPETADERSVSEQQDQALERRRHVYRHRLFVKHIGANRISGFQQITPETFKVFPHRVERLMPWIRRELRAVLSLSSEEQGLGSGIRHGRDPTPTQASTSTSEQPGHRYHQHEEINTGLEVIREYIIAVLKKYDLQTDQAQDLLKDFLEGHTEHFVHELVAFARSSLSIQAYDLAAQYNSKPSNALDRMEPVASDREANRRSQGCEHGRHDSRWKHSRTQAGADPARRKRMQDNGSSSKRQSFIGITSIQQNNQRESGSDTDTSFSRPDKRSRRRSSDDNEALTPQYEVIGAQGLAARRNQSIVSCSSLKARHSTGMLSDAPSSTVAGHPTLSHVELNAAENTSSATGSSANQASSLRIRNVITILQAKLKREHALYEARRRQQSVE